MTLSVLKMAETTIGLLVFCILGVSGHIEAVDDMNGYMVATTSLDMSIALPPVAYVSEDESKVRGYERVARHEVGHLMQAELLHGLFYVIAGLPSVIIHHFGDHETLDSYMSQWPENWAEELGGVQ